MLNSKISVVVVVALLVLVAGYFYLQNQDQVISHEFSGSIVAIEGQEVVVSGVFLSGGEVPNSIGDLVEVRVLVTEGTVIERESFLIPDTDEMFRPDELSKDVTTVGLVDLKRDNEEKQIGFTVKSNKNIYGKKSFEAGIITYIVPDYSNFGI